MRAILRQGRRTVQLAALGLAAAAIAAACNPGKLNVRTLSNRIDLHPAFPHDGGSLTLAGGEIVVQERFDRGRGPSIASTDANGKPLPDGIYSWEASFDAPQVQAVAAGNSGRSAAQQARGTPESEARSRKIRGCRSDRQLSRARVYSGSFEVQGGAIVDPELEEPRPLGRR